MICEADTVGVFQIESRAQMQMLPRTRPRTIDDLAVQVAIIRPGPIVGGAVNPYVRHRQAQLADPNFKPPFDHPSLEPVLSETLGVILYQEQVLQAAIAVAGFTDGQAEALRRAMSRKRSRESMERFLELFLEGARASGVSDDVAKTVFEKIVAFAEFGFPKSHSAAFAFLAYQSAWLRRYYPVEFICALLNAQPMGFYPPHVLTHDAKRHGVTRAAAGHQPEQRRLHRRGRALRIGFGYVKGIGSDRAGHRRRACTQRRFRFARGLRAAHGGVACCVCCPGPWRMGSGDAATRHRVHAVLQALEGGGSRGRLRLPRPTSSSEHRPGIHALASPLRQACRRKPSRTWCRSAPSIASASTAASCSGSRPAVSPAKRADAAAAAHRAGLRVARRYEHVGAHDRGLQPALSFARLPPDGAHPPASGESLPSLRTCCRCRTACTCTCRAWWSAASSRARRKASSSCCWKTSSACSTSSCRRGCTSGSARLSRRGVRHHRGPAPAQRRHGKLAGGALREAARACRAPCRRRLHDPDSHNFGNGGTIFEGRERLCAAVLTGVPEHRAGDPARDGARHPRGTLHPGAVEGAGNRIARRRRIDESAAETTLSTLTSPWTESSTRRVPPRPETPS